MRDDNDLAKDGLLPDDPMEGCERMLTVATSQHLAIQRPSAATSIHALNKQLRVRSDGQLASTRLNDCLLLEHHPDWQARFCWDDFRSRITISGQPLGEVDLVEYANWLDATYGIANVPLRRVHEAVEQVARKVVVNEVVDYLEGLHWDGTERIDSWLVAALGAKDTPLHREYGRRWFIQVAARALEPGCKVDTVLVLVGPQGIGKSTAFRLLVGCQWFNDTDLDLKSKDRFQQIHSAWVHEVSELASFRKAQTEAVKSFVTSTRDRFRPPYARSVQDFPRRCVLVATSNEDSFLSDATGSRRFWPVAVRQLDLNWVTNHRDQLWAEAVHLFRKKEQWWLSDEGEAQRARCSEEFSESDPWEEPIVEWLYERTEGVSIRSLLSEPCGVPTERQSKREQARVASILKRLGWVKRPARERVDGRSISTKLWFPPHDQQ